MKVSALFIRIVILVLPGLVGSLFYRKLRGGRQQKDWRDLAEITLFALSSYALYGAALELWGGAEGPVALQALFDEDVPVRWTEVLVASLVSIGVATLASYVQQFKLIHRFGRRIGATHRFGDEDVWEYFHNSPDTGSWLYVRDHKENFVYYGWLEAYSESGDARELLLSDVEVYTNETEEPLDTVPLMYVSRDAYDFTIEIPPKDSPAEGTNDVRRT
jgi:hypothetical protein